jgi:hypothetical protein
LPKGLHKTVFRKSGEKTDAGTDAGEFSMRPAPNRGYFPSERCRADQTAVFRAGGGIPVINRARNHDYPRQLGKKNGETPNGFFFLNQQGRSRP